jgi:hypothetical protein
MAVPCCFAGFSCFWDFSSSCSLELDKVRVLAYCLVPSNTPRHFFPTPFRVHLWGGHRSPFAEVQKYFFEERFEIRTGWTSCRRCLKYPAKMVMVGGVQAKSKHFGVNVQSALLESYLQNCQNLDPGLLKGLF